MEHSFWHKCWENNALGFHQCDVHYFLKQYFFEACLSSDKHVFVPLCGKSFDMQYLAQALSVTGSELSDIACRDFFEESGVKTLAKQQGGFTLYSYENISLFQGDFFSFKKEYLAKVDWIYDRAALVALPPKMQKKYVEHLKTFFTDHTRLFLVTVEYPKEQLVGPPFSITSPNLETLFEGYDINHVATHELDDKLFAQRRFEVEYLTEKLYIISKKS